MTFIEESNLHPLSIAVQKVAEIDKLDYIFTHPSRRAAFEAEMSALILRFRHDIDAQPLIEYIERRLAKARADWLWLIQLQMCRN